MAPALLEIDLQKLFSRNINQKVDNISRDEYKQFKMQEKFPLSKYPAINSIGDVRDKDRLIAMKEVDYVVHAAALKQVPAAEYNPMEFVKTNIHGAENIIHAAISQKLKKLLHFQQTKRLIL